MLPDKLSYRRRNTERTFLLLISIVMGLLFFQLSGELNKDFIEVPQRISNGTMINFNDNQRGERMRLLLTRGFYFEDKKDIDLIVATIEKDRGTLSSMVDNIGELNKSRYNVGADQAYASAGSSYRKRVEISRLLLGFSETDSTFYEKELNNPLKVGSVTNIGIGANNITGSIQTSEQKPVAGVLIRLQSIVPRDSIFDSEEVSESANVIRFENGVRRVLAADTLGSFRLQSFSAFARTDGSGNFTFTGLPGDMAIEVLPLQPGFQFGRSKGVSQLTDDVASLLYRLPIP